MNLILPEIEETMEVAEAVKEDLARLNPQFLLDSLKEQLPGLLHFSYKLLIALVIVFIGSRIAKAVRRMLKRTFDRMEMELSLSRFLLSAANAGIYCIVLFMAAEKIGIPSASIIALLGSASLAIGLALQGSLANFAGGVLILLMRPFKVGDYIQFSGLEGTVSVIGLVYTTLKTADNKQVVIPNGGLSNAVLTNYTAQDKRRVDVSVGISYQSDLKAAKEILRKIYTNHPLVLQDEEIVVFVEQLADSCVILNSRAWTATADYWTTKWEVTETVKLAFDEAGIEIPYNQMDVCIRYQDEKKEGS